MDMLGKTLSPAGSPFGPNAANTVRRVPRERDGLSQRFGGFYMWNDDPVRTYVQRTLDKFFLQSGNAHQHYGITSYGHPDMGHDIRPVKVAMFRIDNHPIQPQRYRHFSYRCRFQRHP